MRRPRASMAPAMPDTAWVLASDAEAWDTHARACFAAFVEGECPLDVTRKNILNFSQGSFSLSRQTSVRRFRRTWRRR